MSSIGRSSSRQPAAASTSAAGNAAAASSRRSAAPPASAEALHSRGGSFSFDVPGSSRRSLGGAPSMRAAAPSSSGRQAGGSWKSRLSMVTGGSLFGSTTDVVEDAHVPAGAAGGSWRSGVSGGALTPNSARVVSSVRTALDTGDYGPLESALRASQTPSRESPLEPNPTDPRTRWAARSLSSRGMLEVPASWEESRIATDPESLARSPTLSEYDRWSGWQKSHPGQSFGDVE